MKNKKRTKTEEEEEEEEGPLAKKHKNVLRANKGGKQRQKVLGLSSQRYADTRRATPTADSDSLAPAAEPASSTVPEAAAEAAPVVPIDDYTFDQMASDLKRMLAFIATHNEDRRTVETLERRVTSPVVGTDHQTQQFTVGPVASQILPWKESKESPGRSPWVPGAPSAVLQRPSPPPSVPGALIPR